MWGTLKRILKDCATGIDGRTYDPARVAGYGTALLGVCAFVFNSVWTTLHGAAFDPAGFGTGFGLILGGVAAIGGGVALKAHTEPGAALDPGPHAPHQNPSPKDIPPMNIPKETPCSRT